MPANKGKSGKVKKAEWKGYHKVNLSVEDGVTFDAWRVSQHVQFSDLDILANNGYKVSFSWDAYHEGVSASMYCTDAKMEWAGYTLSAWAGDVESALLLLFYKHYIMCEERWEIAPDKPNKDVLPYG